MSGDVESLNKRGAIIAAQTGWNEAFLIGTEADLLDFANSIVNAVMMAKADEFFGEKAKTSNHINGKLSHSSEVQFDWLVVAQDDEQKIEIAHRVAGL